MSEEGHKNVPPFTLRGIYLRGTRVSMAEDFDPLVPGVALHGGYRVASQHFKVSDSSPTTQYRTCAYITRYEFRYLRKKADKVEDNFSNDFFVEISVDVAADYILSEEAEQSQLEEWGASNVLLHTWPYWREFCHSTQLRMNLPATMMPLFMLTTKEENESAEDK